MAQVQLATKISIEAHYKLEEYHKQTGASKASIVDAAIIEFIAKNSQQLSILEEKTEQKKPIRGQDGKFKKA